MRAAYYVEHGGSEKLLIGERATPRPGRGEVLIRIRAAAIGAWDLGVMKSGFGNPALPHVPSSEIAGIVETAPADSGFESGAEVYGGLGFASGGLAEFATVAADRLSHMPDGLSFAEAAALVVPAGTAYEGLMDRAGLQAGETVLITAASGNVGVAAVQVAAAAGATVLALASSRHHTKLADLGASRAFDYHDPAWAGRLKADVLEGVDVLFDGAGGETRRQAVELVKRGGRGVFIVGPPEHLPSDIEAHVFSADITRERLAAINRLVSQGDLKAHIAAQLPLDHAREAMTLIATGETRGRIVVTIA